MKIKSICLLLSIFTLDFTLIACSDDKVEEEKPVVEFSKTEFSVPATGKTDTLDIKSNIQLTLESDQEWCSISRKKNESNTDYTYYVTIANNPVIAERTAIVTAKGESYTGTVTIKQSAPSAGMTSDAKVLAGKMYAGWNIGNTLEAIGGETAWGNPKVTAELIKKVKELGFNAIRIPCSWDQFIEDKTTNKIKESWLNRVSEVVNYCILNDVYAIVNIHWDGGWLEENCTTDKQEENNKKQKALWTQIANKLNTYDEHLLFAGCNEPNVKTAEQMAVLLTYEQTFIDAVRATGGNNATRTLIVQGPSTDIDKTSELFNTLPTDNVNNRLMVEVHCYSPWPFCGQDKDETWGKMNYFWGSANHVSGSDRNSDSKYEEAYIKSQFGKLKTQFVDKGIPVILGEYGVSVRSGLGVNQEAHNKSRGYYNEVVTREAKNNGMVPFSWDTGSMIKRSTNTINDQYVYDGIMTGAKAGKYPY